MQDWKKSNCLLPKTKKLLESFVKEACFLKNYTLVGGSALGFYLNHRKSEDLDFFTYEDYFNVEEIYDFLKNFENKEIINVTNVQMDLLINKVKVTFFNAKWIFLKPSIISNFNLASIEKIAGMKVNTLFLRATYRDYYDLYCLVKKGMTLDELFGYGKIIMNDLNFKLFCSALIYVDDIVDDKIAHLEPLFSISKNDIRDFFEIKIREYVNSKM